MTKTLNELLEENYGQLRDEECKARVIQFLRDVDTIADHSLDFIKRLTKDAVPQLFS